MKKLLTLALLGLIVGLLFSITAAPALAAGNGNGKGNGKGNGNGETVALDQPSPHFGDLVTFTASTDLSNDWVGARCYQSETLVYVQWAQVNNYTSGPFTLGPTWRWTEGGANCVVNLVKFVNGRERVLATTSFDVAP